MLQNDSDLAHLVEKMYNVWEMNHQSTAWWRHIIKHHLLDKDWHISVDIIVVDSRNCTTISVNAMNNIKWWLLFFCFLYCFYVFLCLRSTTMLRITSSPTLLRIQSSGKMKLEKFKSFISIADFKMWESNIEETYLVSLHIGYLHQILYKVASLSILFKFLFLHFKPFFYNYFCFILRLLMKVVDST